jgi:hypothetical protein
MFNRRDLGLGTLERLVVRPTKRRSARDLHEKRYPEDKCRAGDYESNHHPRDSIIKSLIRTII